VAGGGDIGGERVERARRRGLGGPVDDRLHNGEEGYEESASPRTRTQPSVRRPDGLRHSPMAPDLRAMSATSPRESGDFSRFGNPPERVQIVNVREA